MVAKKDADNASVIDVESVENTGGIAVPEIDFAAVKTWEDASNLPTGILLSTHALGDGSVLIEKEQLLNAGEFIVLDWREVTDKKTGNTYLNVLVMNRQNQKARFNDGSTGIARQLREYEAEYGRIPLHCQGVHKSEYITVIDGKDTYGITYYLK
jgi:hypothetical protein